MVHESAVSFTRQRLCNGSIVVKAQHASKAELVKVLGRNAVEW